MLEEFIKYLRSLENKIKKTESLLKETMIKLEFQTNKLNLIEKKLENYKIEFISNCK